MTAYTPIYNLPYVEASDLVASYPTVSEELAENVETAIAGSGGLSLISPTSIANSGGTASSTDGTTTFSGVTSISLNGVFSAAYEHYSILVRSITSTNQAFLVRLRAGGTDTTTNTYFGSFGAADWTTSTNAFVYTNAAARWQWGTLRTATPGNITATIYSPFATGKTAYSGTIAGEDSAGALGGRTEVTTSFDGITLYVASGSITGNVRVYGYKGA